MLVWAFGRIIGEMFVDSEEKEFSPSIFEESFAGAPGCASAERRMQVLGSALTAEPQGFGHGGMPAEASGYGGVATTAEP
ncbi:hypothetical protein CYMTET_51632 [Cymbomonas tetramitiformis]|uniref:Uncharacterized protein n=1 Tax=Cymbomonas tetramitiformis TaxID=36881 RepID=A0AAE0BLT3_9CHLO|nr:hypothetical protein CYMTET_51632 [Cymbomonas tetramitiformis]